MHLRKLELIDWQSHEHTIVTFADGFNCIIGKTRAGKSSIVRALMFMFYDEWEDSYIRTGAKFATVIMTMDNGIVITRSKGGTKNDITVVYPDGAKKDFKKFGVESPPEVKQLIGIYPVSIDADMNEKLNIADQDDAQFLITKSGLVKTKFLNRLTGAHMLDMALRSLNSDRLGTMDMKKTHINSIEGWTRDLAKYRNVEALQNHIDPLYDKANALLVKFTHLQQLKSVRASLTALFSRLTIVDKYLGDIDIYTVKLAQIKAKQESLVKLKEYVLLTHKMASIEKKLTEIDAYNQNLIKLQKKTSTLATIKAYTAYMQKWTAIETTLAAMQTYTEKVQHIRDVLCDKLDKLNNYKDLIDREKYLTLKLTNVDLEYKTLQEKYNICPLCGTQGVHYDR